MNDNREIRARRIIDYVASIVAGLVLGVLLALFIVGKG